MTSHHYTETATPDATKRYPSDLNDWEFDLIAPHVAQKAGSGKKRTVNGGCCRAIFPLGITSGITTEHGGMMAPWNTSTPYSAAMYGPRLGEIPNQVLG